MTHLITTTHDPAPAPPVDDGPEDNYGGWRTGSVWSGRRAIGWSDGPPETAGDDNCSFAAARLITVAACLVLIVLKLTGIAWTDDDPPIIDDDPHEGDPPPPPIYY